MKKKPPQPMTPRQINELLIEVQEAGMALQGVDESQSDLLLRCEHCIDHLWLECGLHNNMTNEAEAVLLKTERRLRECLLQVEDVKAMAAESALREASRLKGRFTAPTPVFALVP